MLGGGWSDALVHPALEIGFAEMATLAVIVAVRLDARHVLLHDRLALAFTTDVSRGIKGWRGEKAGGTYLHGREGTSRVRAETL